MEKQIVVSLFLLSLTPQAGAGMIDCKLGPANRLDTRAAKAIYASVEVRDDSLRISEETIANLSLTLSSPRNITADLKEVSVKIRSIDIPEYEFDIFARFNRRHSFKKEFQHKKMSLVLQCFYSSEND